MDDTSEPRPAFTVDEIVNAPRHAPEDDDGTVVRLGVYLASSTMKALREGSEREHVSITEGLRRAIAVWRLVRDAQHDGARVFLATGAGEDMLFREVIVAGADGAPHSERT